SLQRPSPLWLVHTLWTRLTCLRFTPSSHKPRELELPTLSKLPRMVSFSHRMLLPEEWTFLVSPTLFRLEDQGLVRPTSIVSVVPDVPELKVKVSLLLPTLSTTLLARI